MKSTIYIAFIQTTSLLLFTGRIKVGRDIGISFVVCHSIANQKDCANLENDVSCDEWADAGECVTNFFFMQEQCAASCGYCVDDKSEQSCFCF
jgi:hypothetical protein